jgi:hypothetical protein
MDPFKDLLNALIKAKLPEINAAISNAIKSRGLDPMVDVLSGSDVIGSINLGVCEAKATASYTLKDLTGLSSFFINSLVITSANSNPDGSAVTGAIAMTAQLGSIIGIRVGGRLKAECGVIDESVGISGSVTASDVTITAAGDFTATVDSSICLTEIDVVSPGLNYGKVNIDIDGLGILNKLLEPLEDYILGLVKGPIINLIESNLTPVINSTIKGLLPICTSLS